MGFVTAVRLGAFGWAYGVYAGVEGIGWSSPDGRTRLLREEDLASTGRIRRECDYADWEWSRKTIPKFERYEEVTAIPEWGGEPRRGMVSVPPYCSPEGEWD